jgi:hypothetical protein
MCWVLKGGLGEGGLFPWNMSDVTVSVTRTYQFPIAPLALVAELSVLLTSPVAAAVPCRLYAAAVTTSEPAKFLHCVGEVVLQPDPLRELKVRATDVCHIVSVTLSSWSGVMPVVVSTAPDRLTVDAAHVVSTVHVPTVAGRNTNIIAVVDWVPEEAGKLIEGAALQLPLYWHQNIVTPLADRVVLIPELQDCPPVSLIVRVAVSSRSWPRKTTRSPATMLEGGVTAKVDGSFAEPLSAGLEARPKNVGAAN